MPSLPISFTVKPNVDTQGTAAQVGSGITESNLIRIKNGYVQKLLGCTLYGVTLGGVKANFILPWAPVLGGTTVFLVGIGTVDTLQVFENGSGVDITPVAWTGSGDWTLALWGDWLLSASRGQSIYYWIPALPISSPGPALPVSALAGATGVPTAVNGIFVAAPQQQAFAWGIFSATLGAQDPLLIGWCDIANLQDWTASAINQAGSFKLSSGSRIVAGTWFGSIGLFWTDIELWAAQYIGFPLVYGFNRVGENCGLIARQAWGALGTRVAWMGNNDFYLYQGGAVSVIPCSVRDFVFNSLDRGLSDAIHCDVNSFGNEFMWRFPQKGNHGVCTAYVKWSPDENSAWDYGQGEPNICAWSDTVDTKFPLGIDYSGNILNFEDDVDFNGVVLDSFFATGWFYIDEGQKMVTVERVNPGFVFNQQPGFGGSFGGSVTMTFYFADEIPETETVYPIRTYGPYTVTQTTPFIIVRGRGRVMMIRVDSNVAGTFYRNGKHLARVTVDGHR